MKKRLALAILVLLVALFSTTAYAAPKVFLYGKEISFDVPPIIEDGRTLVPLRAIFSALGADVKWDSYTQTVTAVKGNTNIKLIIGGKAYINFQPVDLDVPAKIVEGRTMVPLRFVTESLNCNVEWNKDTQTILLTSKIEEKDLLEAKSGYKVFQTGDYCMRYPEKWEYSKLSRESTGAKVSFYYFFPENVIKNTDKSVVAVNIDEYNFVLSLEQYIGLNISGEKKLYGDFKMGETSDTTLSGFPAKRISFTGKMGDVRYKQTSVYTVIGRKVYGVHLLEYGSATPVVSEFEEAKNSFTIK